MTLRKVWTFGAGLVALAWLWFALIAPSSQEWKPLTAEQIEARCGWQDPFRQRECRDHHARLNESVRKLEANR